MAKKILVIEDDKFLRKVITKKLLKEEYIVVEAIDGEGGIRALKIEKPHLVLLDLVLPEADGFEVLARIKKDPTISEIPVIILSNLGQREDVQRGLDLGADDYLIKSHFNPGEIVTRIELVLRKKHETKKQI